MDCKSFPFDKLPFSKLFQSYINGSDNLKPFVEAHPFDDTAVTAFVESLTFAGDRDKSADELIQFNRQFGCEERTLQQVEKLRDSRSIAIVTGQQLTLFGGPLFTVYKLLTAVIYARRWEERFQRPVVPVFWLADEDHDFREAVTLGILNDDHYKHISYNGNDSGDPVGRQAFGQELQSAIDQLRDALPETDFTPGVFELLTDCYKTGHTFRQAFGSLLLKLFGKYGLVLAGSDNEAIKRLTSEPLIEAVQKQADLYQLLDQGSRHLEEAGYHRQATVQPSNIFYLDPDSGRQKIDFSDGVWSTQNGHSWNSDELIRHIEEHPETVSPNVFLRPVLQDRLLPTAAFVAGPGETAYYTQMKELYQLLGQTMPVIIPRFSATLIEPPIERIMKKLPFTLSDYSQRTEDLEFRTLDSDKKREVEALFKEWATSVREISDGKIEKIKQVDPTLKKSADKAGTRFENELSQLKGKVFKSLKRDEEIQIERIRRIQNNLFPNHNLQEREIAFVTYMNKYGLDIWDDILDTLSEELPESHKLIYLS